MVHKKQIQKILKRLLAVRPLDSIQQPAITGKKDFAAWRFPHAVIVLSKKSRCNFVVNNQPANQALTLNL